MRRALALAMLFSGCADTGGDEGAEPESGDTGASPDTDGTDDTDDTDDPEGDADQDGFAVPDDCDDGDPTIHPEAVEACDGIDNDCDGTADDEFAATVEDESFVTLDDALESVDGNDTIQVCPGDWAIDGVERNDGLALVGVAGRDATRIMEASAGTVFTMGSESTLAITGIDVTGSVSDGIVLLDSATLVMTDSRVSAHQGAGIAAEGPVTIELTRTDVEDNVSSGDGGGISSSRGATLRLVDSNIRRNSAVTGGGIYSEATFVVGEIVLTNSTISDNRADVGGGIATRLTPIVGDGSSFVSDNTAGGDGGGIAMYDAPVEGVSIIGNVANRGGGVAVLHDDTLDGAVSTSSLTGVVLDSNAADLGGAIHVDDGSVGFPETLVVGATSSITLNTATTSGGGAHLGTANANLDSQGADWGTDGVDDNSPDDVGTGAGAETYEGASAFVCNGLTGCQ